MNEAGCRRDVKEGLGMGKGEREVNKQRDIQTQPNDSDKAHAYIEETDSASQSSSKISTKLTSYDREKRFWIIFTGYFTFRWL